MHGGSDSHGFGRENSDGCGDGRSGSSGINISTSDIGVAMTRALTTRQMQEQQWMGGYKGGRRVGKKGE